MSVQWVSDCKFCIRTVESCLSYFLTCFIAGGCVWKDINILGGSVRNVDFLDILWVTGMQRIN